MRLVYLSVVIVTGATVFSALCLWVELSWSRSGRDREVMTVCRLCSELVGESPELAPFADQDAHQMRTVCRRSVSRVVRGGLPGP